MVYSASLDQRVCVWSVSSQSVLCTISICRVPTVVAWCVGHRLVLVTKDNLYLDELIVTLYLL